jgi:dipeptidyl-peptidase-4
MTDTFPRQNARTQRFTLGVPRSFQISPDGDRIVFLRSKGGSDPVTCLWLLDVAAGTEYLIADPAELGAAGDGPDEAEKARRERSREQAAGIVAFGCDADVRLAVFGLAGQVYAADLTGAAAGSGGGNGDGARPGGSGVREVPALAPAADPRPDPAGRLVAYVCDGALRVTDLASGEDRAIAAPGEAPNTSFGLAEFLAAEEMGRGRGYWWAPDSGALLVARVDESPVQRWHIADPSNPGRPPAEVRYPAAGTPNADVSLELATLGGQRTPVSWDSATFPYLVTACWAGPGAAADTPLIVVQSRDQREMRILAVDRQTGATTVVRADTDPHWLDIIPGVPARTAGGRIVWTADSGGAHRLIVATADELSAGRAVPVTPDELQVREVLSVDGETVLFAASDAEPTETGLWTYGPAGLARLVAGDGAPGDGGPGTLTGRRAGGTTVAVRRSLDQDGATIDVLRDAQTDAQAGAGAPAGAEAGAPAGAEAPLPRETRVARITSLADTPLLPVPRPDIFPAGEHGIRTALLLPSWHQPGAGRLPVLMDPYGGPHGQLVKASRGAFLTSQWFAEQGFAVVIADGRGTPGRGPGWEKTVAGDLAGPPLDDQVTALHAAAARCADLDLGTVAIRGWSFGGYLSALAVLRRPDVFHAAIAGAPVTEWRLYDTHYTERYLGHPDESAAAYDACSLLTDAHKLSRPLLIIHGLADDNVVVAHSLRLSSALLAAGRPHSVLPLSGVTHMAAQEEVAENLLLLQVDFLRKALGAA